MPRKHAAPLSNEEETGIQAGIASDPDNPELTDEELASLKPFHVVFPELAEAIKRSRGRPKLDAPKQAVTLRLAPETIARYKTQGGDWRDRMSKAIEKSIA